MSKELELADRYKQMNDVIDLHLKGNNPTQIARELGLKRAEVLSYVDEFKEIAKSDEGLRARSQEVVHEFDQHQNMIVKRMWETVEQADLNSDLKTKATVLKNLADIEAKRVETLQKAGLISDAGIADEMAEMEEKQQILIGILKEVTADCDHCKYEVHKRLAKVTGKPEPIIVVQEVSPNE